MPKKRVSLCRCWKSKKWPLSDGAHKYHNKDNNDKVGPVVLVWNEPEPEPELDSKTLLDTSIIEADMDIKSIDSVSPILQSSNGDSNGEFDQLVPIEGNVNASSDELSSLEMIEGSFNNHFSSDEKQK